MGKFRRRASDKKLFAKDKKVILDVDTMEVISGGCEDDEIWRNRPLGLSDYEIKRHESIDDMIPHLF